jgi:MscS family membrane protein
MRKIFAKYLFKLIGRFTSQTKTNFDDQLLAAFERPVRALLLFLGFYLGLMILPLSNSMDIFINKVFRSLIIFFFAWGSYDLVGTDTVLWGEYKRKMRMDNILISFFSRVIRFIILAITLVLVANEWNYDVNGFIAGLGLGGLAFALAAKDMLANIFGGIVIIMERPFSIGDWVETPRVEGVVEDISFRSTKFRNASQALVTVPNSTLAAEPISNLSKMGMRLLKFNIKVPYTTPPEKMKACIYQINELLQNHPAVKKQNIQAYFEKIGDKSMEILISCYTGSVIKSEYLAVKEEINYKILEILAHEEVELI